MKHNWTPCCVCVCVFLMIWRYKTRSTSFNWSTWRRVIGHPFARGVGMTRMTWGFPVGSGGKWSVHTCFHGFTLPGLHHKWKIWKIDPWKTIFLEQVAPMNFPAVAPHGSSKRFERSTVDSRWYFNPPSLKRFHYPCLGGGLKYPPIKTQRLHNLGVLDQHRPKKWTKKRLHSSGLSTTHSSYIIWTTPGLNNTEQ